MLTPTDLAGDWKTGLRAGLFSLWFELGGAASAAASGAGGAGGGARQVSLPVPQALAAARQLNLVVQDVELARNRAAKFYVRAATARGKPPVLGSFAVLADAPDAAGTRHMGPFRVNVTATLRRWRQANPRAPDIQLTIDGVDGEGRSVPATIGAVDFEIAPR